MQILTTYLPFNNDQFPYWISAPEHSLLCDIETCGFSARLSMIYMIGCGSFESGRIRIDQYFAGTAEEEPEILKLFLARLQGIKALYTFNGTGFDLPFLKERMKKYSIDSAAINAEGCDIFKEVSTLKKLIHLENYKQKTVEAYLGICREDTYSGGELIDVYKEYQKAPDKETLNLLFLHNKEDVAGMARLLPLYHYRRLLQGPLTLVDAKVHTYPGPDGEDAFELLLSLKGCCPVPVKATAREAGFFLSVQDDLLTLRAPILKKELRYFYPDYKNYYYLAAEDRAIHKSIAASVDAAYRSKCRAANCYTRKDSFFLPQNQVIITPDFYTEYKSHPAYFEMTADFFREPENLIFYGKKMMEWILA